MASVIDSVTTQFAQTNLIVKAGHTKLMSGELNLSNLDGVGVSIVCYVGKKKRAFSQEMEGNVDSFQAYVMAAPDVSPTIEPFDLIITQRGEKFMVGPVSQRNNETTINSELDVAAYVYADLEIYTNE